jgi:triosephosphate isomerase
MRIKIVAGNWKMNKDAAGSAELLEGLKAKCPSLPSGVKAVVCPPFTSLALAKNILAGTQFELGAQNMYPENEGAFTGEISPAMLKSVGCTYVILGHSERRQYFAETDAFINTKVKKAFAEGLNPILCVGETLAQREKNITDEVVTTQVKGGLAGIPASDAERLIIAYEPVWAIGTGKVATPAQAQEVHKHIRAVVAELYGQATAQKVIIQYGGSVKPDNAKELLHQDDIDGALVGGACLKADSFAAIIQAAQ